MKSLNHENLFKPLLKITFYSSLLISELQAKRFNEGDRLERKRKSRFGEDEDMIPEKTLMPRVRHILWCILFT